MSILALQQFATEYYPDERSNWTDLIGPVVVLLVGIPILIWLVLFLGRALKQGKACLDQSTTGVGLAREGIDVSRESIELARQTIELQRESNRLLAQLNETLKNRPLT